MGPLDLLLLLLRWWHPHPHLLPSHPGRVRGGGGGAVRGGGVPERVGALGGVGAVQVGWGSDICMVSASSAPLLKLTAWLALLVRSKARRLEGDVILGVTNYHSLKDMVRMFFVSYIMCGNLDTGKVQ